MHHDLPAWTNSNLKKRILPVLLAQGLIERHALTSHGKLASDPQERAQRLTEKTLYRHSLSSGQAATSTTSQPLTTTMTPGSRTTTEFVWAVPHALLSTSSQNPVLRNPATTERLEQHLNSLTSGRETVIELSAKVRALRAAENLEQEARKKYSVSTLQHSWDRPVGVVVSGPVRESGNSSRVGGAKWVTSRGEKRHLNKRRAGTRIGKERKMQVWWDALGEAKKQGQREALA